MRHSRRLPAFLLAASLAALPAAGCVRNPATGERQLSFFSEAQEIQMGREYDAQIVASLGLYPDSALQRYVQELGARLAAGSERPHLPWTFRVLDDPVVNAFALPGGYIYVTRGILAYLGSEAELASVLGHEIGHVTARHSVSRMSTQQLAQLGLAIGVLVRPELETAANIASAGLSVLFLKYSRDDERQADDLGLRYMRRASYDPREMADVFAMLERVSAAEGGGRVPEWLSTHPDPGDRRARISAQVAALPPDSATGRVERESFLRRLDGLVFGQNPREGFFRGTEFLHPDLAFRFVFPAGWRTSNQRSAVLAMSPAEDAVVQITLAEEATPEAAARRFFGGQGMAGSPRSDRINGLDAVTGSFATATQSGPIRGIAAFIAHGGRVYNILAYAAESRWPAYDAAARQAIGSFDRLTDQAALAVQPQRLDVVMLERAMTLEEFARRHPGPASLEDLARLNQAEPTTRFAAGELVKRITGSPPPGASE
jgi:predicted Zn-dependent protease